MFESIPPIHRYLPLTLGQAFSRQRLERVPEPKSITDELDNVLQYDRVMSTRLAIAYAIGIETIYQARQQPFGGSAIDLACGPGHFSICMAKHLRLDNLIGIDISPPMIEVATRNAISERQPQLLFKAGDVTQLTDMDDNQFELSTFMDAAHHFPDAETVTNVISQMERITNPSGLICVMDLVRLKTMDLTDKYVRLVGRDYHEQGLSAFYKDFQNSMRAAWSLAEFRRLAPESPKRTWFHVYPRGLATIQLLVGVPHEQARVKLRRGMPWSRSSHPVSELLRLEWNLARGCMKLRKHRSVNLAKESAL
jgi:ubiquinone/menaquinone biosynthesis C-methylase UbiE